MKIFGKPSDLKKLNTTSICIGDSRIIPSFVATNIGVDLDSGLKLEKQVNKMVSSGWYHLSNTSRVRKYFTQEVTEALVHDFVTSKLDTYNSSLAGILSAQIQNLQKIQNAAAKLPKVPKFDSTTKIRKELHWLPISPSIQFKLLLLTHKSPHGQGPKYLSDPAGTIHIPSTISLGKRWRSINTESSQNKILKIWRPCLCSYCPCISEQASRNILLLLLLLLYYYYITI